MAVGAACLTLACEADVGATRAAQRPDTPDTTDLPPVFGDADVVETHDSAGGRFRVHFTRAGQHAVPLDDDDMDGTPDYVQEVGEEYERVLAFFTDELGFAAPLSDADVPDNGGDDRFDVYLLDFPPGADGSFRRDECTLAPTRCPGHMLQENDFAGRGYPSRSVATRILASHELFHAVQAGYEAEPGVVVGEGTAVWASEAYDPSLDDFESFVGGYLSRPERSLGQEPTGPVDPFSYGAGLFFRFLEERHDRGVIRELWETPAPGGAIDWLAALDAVLATRGSSFPEAFAELARWNLYTARRADAELAWAEGAAYPPVTERAVELPYADDLVRVFPASVRYYAAPTGGRGEVEVASTAADPADLADVRLLLAFEEDGRITHTRETAEARLSAPAQTATTVHVALVGTATSGGSRRVGLCVGSPAEVSACLAEGTEADGGPTPVDAGAPDAGLAPPTSGGCAVGTPRALPAGWALLAALGLLARRRRR